MAVALAFMRGGVGLHIGGTEFKEHGTQRILKDHNTVNTPNAQNDSANGFMGYGGALTLVNGSPLEWTLSSQTSYQMDTWKWPNVAAGTEIGSLASTAGYNTNAYQVKRKESTSNSVRSGSQRMIGAKHTTTLPALGRNSRYSERKLRITS